MEVSFRTRKLQKALSSKRSLDKAYGNRMAKRIMMRLAVLTNAASLSEVPRTPPDRCHMLTGDRSGQFAVDLEHPYRLVFVPNHDPVPRKEDGGVDLDEVTAVTIIAVEDYH